MDPMLHTQRATASVSAERTKIEKNELTLITSEDRASLCDPRKRNGRMLVGSRLYNDGEWDAGVTDDRGGVFSEA